MQSLSRGSSWAFFAAPEIQTPDFLYDCIKRKDSLFEKVMKIFDPHSNVIKKALELASSVDYFIAVEVLKEYMKVPKSPSLDNIQPLSEENN